MKDSAGSHSGVSSRGGAPQETGRDSRGSHGLAVVILILAAKVVTERMVIESMVIYGDGGRTGVKLVPKALVVVTGTIPEMTMEETEVTETKVTSTVSVVTLVVMGSNCAGRCGRGAGIWRYHCGGGRLPVASMSWVSPEQLDPLVDSALDESRTR